MNQQIQPSYTEYDEISLRELIEVLLNGKWIIAIITAICVLLSVIYAQFIMAPVYEAKATLMASPLESTQVKDANQFSQLVDELSQYPQMTIDTYIEQVTTPTVLSAVIKELKLDEEYDINRANLKNMITIESPKGTNLIYVKVKNSDPVLATNIANAISTRYVDFITETIQTQTGKSAEFIEEQLVKEKENVDKATDALTAFLAQPRGVRELEQELSSKLTQLTEFKTRVTQLKVDKEATNAALIQAKKALETTPTTLKTTKSIASDALMTEITMETTGEKLGNIAGIEMTDEQLNPAYTSLLLNVKNYEIELAKNTTELNSLQREIQTRQKEIEQLQAELAEKQNESEILNYEVNLAKQTRDAYQQKLKEANIKQSAEIGRSSVIIVADALEPLNRVNGKTIVVAIAGVLGLMISVFFVFFMSYWKTSGKEQLRVES